jgi:hypothetical protein
LAALFLGTAVARLTMPAGGAAGPPRVPRDAIVAPLPRAVLAATAFALAPGMRVFLVRSGTGLGSEAKGGAACRLHDGAWLIAGTKPPLVALPFVAMGEAGALLRGRGSAGARLVAAETGAALPRCVLRPRVTYGTD